MPVEIDVAATEKSFGVEYCGEALVLYREMDIERRFEFLFTHPFEPSALLQLIKDGRIYISSNRGFYLPQEARFYRPEQMMLLVLLWPPIVSCVLNTIENVEIGPDGISFLRNWGSPGDELISASEEVAFKCLLERVEELICLACR